MSNKRQGVNTKPETSNLSIQAIYESSKQQQKNIAISMISKTQELTENSSCQTFTAIGSSQLTTTMHPGISAVSVAVISQLTI